MNYTEVSVQVPPEALDLACAFLHEMGAGGVVIDDEAAGQVRIWLPRDERLVARLGDLGNGLQRLAPGAWSVGQRPAQTDDWAHAWKRYWHATRVGARLVVVPSWESYETGASDLVLRLDPGMAFGTGTHASTLLCLRALEELVGPGATVADVGTGSGILAIAAAKLGASRVWAVDVDPVAVRAARENTLMNDVEVTVVEGGPEAVPSRCDIVVANLTADLHVALAAAEAQLLGPAGILVASGIVAAEADRVTAMFRALRLAPSALDTMDGWCCMRLRSTAAA
ncbi:MAG TPA: 50S ribosomal protein L11 methyltransferase [Bacillota bacterium]|nr:50S ribosomal protein L11 methyltransferase [Bacillota bacterium]